MWGGKQALLRAVQQWDQQPGSGESGSELPISVSVQAQGGVTPAEISALTELWASRNPIGPSEAGMGPSRLLAAETRLPALQPLPPPSQHTLLAQLFRRRVGLPATGEEQRPLKGRCLHYWSPQPPERAGGPSTPPPTATVLPPLTPLGVMISLSKALYELFSLDPTPLL